MQNHELLKQLFCKCKKWNQSTLLTLCHIDWKISITGNAKNYSHFFRFKILLALHIHILSCKNLTTKNIFFSRRSIFVVLFRCNTFSSVCLDIVIFIEASGVVTSCTQLRNLTNFWHGFIHIFMVMYRHIIVIINNLFGNALKFVCLT